MMKLTITESDVSGSGPRLARKEGERNLGATGRRGAVRVIVRSRMGSYHLGVRSLLLGANRGLPVRLHWAKCSRGQVSRFDKPKGEPGIPSRLLTAALVMWLPDMLRPTEALRKSIPKGLGLLCLRPIFSGEDAEFLTVGQFLSVATCCSVHGILLFPPRR